MLTPAFKVRFLQALEAQANITFLVGAGISAESGIPTFRGDEGFWKVGSTNYKPQEIGTYEMFLEKPYEVWKWFLYRQTACRKADPNPGHYALVEMEKLLGDRFALVSQNVDGLHIRAGNSPERLYSIHGDLSFARCGVECSKTLYPFPKISKDREEDLTEAEKQALVCPNCGELLRPHVLWFDEFYSEGYYRATSALNLANDTDILFVVGTTGATNLPVRIFQRAYAKGAAIVVIDPKPNVFSEAVEQYEQGYVFYEKSGEILPEIAGLVGTLLAPS